MEIMKIKINNVNLEVEGNSEFWSDAQDKVWEPYTFDVLDRFADSTKNYVDLGAWVGPTVLYACNKFKHCYCAEPDTVAQLILKRNLKLSNLEANVTIKSLCITDSNGLVRIGSREFGNSATSLYDNRNSVNVLSMSLEQFFRSCDIKDCALIKMDIEGAERIVLKECCKFLKTTGSSLYLSLHHGFFKDQDEFFKDISGVFDIYNNIYTAVFDKIEREQVMKGLFSEILLTNSNL